MYAYFPSSDVEKRTVMIESDFPNILNGSPFISTVSGTGAVINNLAGVISHSGIVSLDSGTTATGRVAMSTAVNFIGIDSTMSVMSRCIFRIPTLSVAAQRFQFRTGFINTLTGDQVDGIYLEYDDTISANFIFKTAANSVRTSVITSILVTANTWNKVMLYVVDNIAYCVLNDIIIATINTNIPQGPSRTFGIGSALVKSVGTTNRTIDVDYLGGIVEFVVGR